jgi:hypothetical protein
MKNTEQDLVNSIIEYIQYRGGVATRINSGGIPKQGKDGSKYYVKLAPKGTSDIIACFEGRYYAIECKLDYNKPTPEQLEFLKSVISAGGLAIIAYKLEDVISYFQ